MKSQFIKLLVFTFILTISKNSHAQNFILGIGDYINYANINRTNSPTIEPYGNIKGSPYILEEFEIGKIKLKDGKTYEGPLRYDIYANQFEFKTKEGEVYSIINPEKIEKISLSKKQFVFITDKAKSNTGNYCEVLVEGEYSLLVQHTVILKDPVPAKPYVDAKPARFVTKDDKFYIKNENSGLVEIKNKDVIVAIDPTRSADISKYINGSKIKVSNKSDLIELMNFLNAN